MDSIEPSPATLGATGRSTRQRLREAANAVASHPGTRAAVAKVREVAEDPEVRDWLLRAAKAGAASAVLVMARRADEYRARNGRAGSASWSRDDAKSALRPARSDGPGTSLTDEVTQALRAARTAARSGEPTYPTYPETLYLALQQGQLFRHPRVSELGVEVSRGLDRRNVVSVEDVGYSQRHIIPWTEIPREWMTVANLPVQVRAHSPAEGERVREVVQLRFLAPSAAMTSRPKITRTPGPSAEAVSQALTEMHAARMRIQPRA